jgi:Zn finger protein HypA/HybF involved in hydrogenase expression
MVALFYCSTCDRPLYSEEHDTRCPVCYTVLAREVQDGSAAEVA